MTQFTVKEVVDGDTFSVAGGWTYKSNSGEFVRPLGYDTPEARQPGYAEAKAKLVALIQGKIVDINEVASIDVYERLLANVYYNGKNLADYFPEYRK